jgi:hypothetical protein
VAHPDLQEVSTHPCDTGTPLGLLRNEFPLIEFPDELFPKIWDRESTVMMGKKDTIYDDKPELLYNRSVRVRQWLKDLDAVEIVIITHASFAHFLFNDWLGPPGEPSSRSFGTQLGHGEARTFTLPGKNVPGVEFGAFATSVGPAYPLPTLREDYTPQVYRLGKRDCGVFTEQSLR